MCLSQEHQEIPCHVTCDQFHWQTEEWSACAGTGTTSGSTECGAGIQSRIVRWFEIFLLSSFTRRRQSYTIEHQTLLEVTSRASHNSHLRTRPPFWPWNDALKFRDNISNCPVVLAMLANRQTNRQTIRQSHKHTLLKTILPWLRYASRVVKICIKTNYRNHETWQIFTERWDNFLALQLVLQRWNTFTQLFI